MIAYFIEAALVSLFLFAMGLYRLTYHGKSVANQEAPPHSPLARVLDAFRGSTTGFWSATAIISLTMLIISLRMTARARIYAERAVLSWRQGSAVSAYDTELATVVSVFSLFPVLILGLLAKNRGRRRWLMRAVHFILYVLVLAQIRLGIKHTSVASTISSLGRACNPSSVDRLFHKYGSPVFYVLIAIPIGLAVISATAAVFRLRRGKRAHQQTETKTWCCTLHFSRPYEAFLKLFTCVACFTLMWASLGLLLFMRGEILQNVGHDDPALEWSFGQLLALATWFPVFVEWVYILICKIPHYILACNAILTQPQLVWKEAWSVMCHRAMQSCLQVTPKWHNLHKSVKIFTRISSTLVRTNESYRTCRLQHNSDSQLPWST
jgi:hypothetical protein